MTPFERGYREVFAKFAQGLIQTPETKLMKKKIMLGDPNSQKAIMAYRKKFFTERAQKQAGLLSKEALGWIPAAAAGGMGGHVYGSAFVYAT